MFGKKTTSDNIDSAKGEKEGSTFGESNIFLPVGGVQNVPVAVETESSLIKKSELLEKANEFSYNNQDSDLLRYLNKSSETQEFIETKSWLINTLIETIDIVNLYKIPMERRKTRVFNEAGKLLQTVEVPLTGSQVQLLQEQVIDEVLGFGPLEPLLKDEDVADIMINTAKMVFVERSGRIYLTDITFMNESHLMAVIQRIVTRVGRRIDEASPMVDARLPDGSRFNAIIPPLALDGALVSIRKFKKSKICLKDYVDYDSMTEEMARFLEICGNIRLNIIISGGTGSGKTTLLNAISNHIDDGERVITIEDAAELQLGQPHVLRLETRPASNEGIGEIGQRQLVKNALRMRPDRIILGEIRGEEVIDVLSAMNTGHDGSLATIHSNSPRDCLARIENLVNMSGVAVSNASLRYQISSAVQLIVQLQRMRDGKRRITHIEEVVGQEGEVIVTQPMFSYKSNGVDINGNLQGEFVNHGIRPRFLNRAESFGKDKELVECLGLARNI